MTWTYVANLAPGSGPAPIPPPPAYVRPADWLPLPTVANGEEKMVGLYAVWNHDSNFIAINSLLNAITVDWGDGSPPENYGASVQAQHIYDYNSIPAGTFSTRGYRQVIVTVTGQAGGAMGVVDLCRKHSAAGASNQASNGWLDIRASGIGSRIDCGKSGGLSRCTQLEQFEYIGLPASLATSQFADCYSLQNFIVEPDFFTKGNTLLAYFNACASLRSLPPINTSTITGFQSTFNLCTSLEYVPDIDTSKATTFTGMFSGCNSLRRVPTTMDTSSAITLSQMFSGCYALGKVPDTFNLSKAQAINEMFKDCRSLSKAPDLNAPLCTDAAGLFNGCTSLVTVPSLYFPLNASCQMMFQSCTSLNTAPLFDTSNSSGFAYMFWGCSSLTEIPLYNTSKGLNFARMFYGCTVLNRVPVLDTALGTDFSYMFYGCSSLIYCPAINTSNGTNFANMFYTCSSLQVIPALDMSKATSAFTSTFTQCYSLTSMQAVGINKTVAFTNFRLSTTALNTIYGNLATIGGQTITVTGNPGTTGDDPSIATAKGWTVTGS